MTGTLRKAGDFSGSERTALESLCAQYGRSLFQDARWLDVCSEAYGLTPWYYTVPGQGAVPLVETGGILVSLPFIDYTSPIAAPDAETGIVSVFLKDVSALEARVMFRSFENHDRPGGIHVHDKDITMRLSLRGTADDIWKGFSPKVRNQVRKPEKAGVKVVDSAEHLKEFYGIWARHINGLGTPAHSYRFFKSVFTRFTSGNCRLLTAWQGDEMLGGLVLMQDRETAYVPWAAVDKRYRSLCISHILYWHAIRESVESGNNVFDFLRSRRDAGTYHFKKQWGAEEYPLYYYCNFAMTDMKRSWKYGLASALWRRLPGAVTGILGPGLRKSIP